MKFKSVFQLALSLLFLSWASLSHAIESEYWGFCNAGKAYNDAGFTSPKSDADWVCQAPTADATGEAIERNTLRCLLDQKESCQLDAGGDPGARGDHNVPRSAWYWIPGATLDYPDVRCECGCFTADVEVLTHLGPMRMDKAAENASSLGGLSMAIFASDHSGYKGSLRLTNKDFVVGPEEKPIVRIMTSSGHTLTMTDAHPVLVLRDDAWQMVRAESLGYGDILMSAKGGEEKVTEVTSYLLPELNRLVYNFDTNGANEYEHIIVANNLRVGDLNWQKRLSEKNSRSENFLKFAQQ
jgi:hypothetical protein